MVGTRERTPLPNDIVERPPMFEEERSIASRCYRAVLLGDQGSDNPSLQAKFMIYLKSRRRYGSPRQARTATTEPMTRARVAPHVAQPA